MPTDVLEAAMERYTFWRDRRRWRKALAALERLSEEGDAIERLGHEAAETSQAFQALADTKKAHDAWERARRAG